MSNGTFIIIELAAIGVLIAIASTEICNALARIAKALEDRR